VVVNTQSANNNVGLDREVCEAGRGHGNAGRRSDNEALVRGKGKATVVFEFLLDVVGKSGSISGTFLLSQSRSGRREVVDMQGQQGSGVSLLNGPKGWGE
jgi:hypothetical protein